MLPVLGVIYHCYHRHFTKTHFFFNFLIVLCLFSNAFAIGEMIWAINCGGNAHTDVHGIRYDSDPLRDVGFASDYGKNLIIQRVVPQDQILYQTERYHLSTFTYDMPVWKDGDYVLVMKFSEVWFMASNQKVFDVVLNGEHTVVSELDIFNRVGRGVAHDEIIPFSIKGGRLRVGGEQSRIDSKKISLEFVKGDLDNPKVNAIYVMKGSLEDVPRLPPLPNGEPPAEEEDEEEEEELQRERLHRKASSRQHRPSAPRVKDPYAGDNTSTMLLPVFIAIGAFIPLLFCLCKL
ncbi:malectin-B-like [Babylonia areolata]|uniref:malectin-B-like n=1 Tax=Babylonia areolata TaxID=304850 RepID=UPI003FD62D41